MSSHVLRLLWAVTVSHSLKFRGSTTFSDTGHGYYGMEYDGNCLVLSPGLERNGDGGKGADLCLLMLSYYGYVTNMAVVTVCVAVVLDPD